MATAKAARKKSRRTVMYSSGGKKLYAVRDASGQFKDIQQYSRAHAMDIQRGSAAESKVAAKKAAKAAKKTAARSAGAKKPATKSTVKRAVKKVSKRVSTARKAAGKLAGRLRSAVARVRAKL